MAIGTEQFVLGTGAFQPSFGVEEDLASATTSPLTPSQSKPNPGNVGDGGGRRRRRRRRRTTVTLTTLIRGNKGNVGVLAEAARRVSVASPAPKLTGGENSDTDAATATVPLSTPTAPPPPPASGGSLLDQGGVFFLGSTLQLMETVSKRAESVGNILPILNDLLGKVAFLA